MKLGLKRGILAAVAISTIGAGAMGTATFAQSVSDAGEMPEFVQRLAERFNLDVTEVQEVFTEFKAEHKAEAQAKQAEKQQERFDEAVTNGDLTTSQVQLIENKRAELKASFEENRDTFKDLSEEERKALKESTRSEVEAWAEANGIDAKWLKPGKRGHHKQNLRGGQNGDDENRRPQSRRFQRQNGASSQS